MHAQHFRSHHRIIWPASLRMLPLYTLGDCPTSLSGLNMPSPLVASALRPLFGCVHGVTKAISRFKLVKVRQGILTI